AYIQEQRMQEACRQLRYTTLSVQEISEWLGYESATYFVRSFHKARGQTPLEYRKMVMDESPEK
ncbi:helix-turn-helix domain-containing protein, partial [Bacteroides heparinolyticus]